MKGRLPDDAEFDVSWQISLNRQHGRYGRISTRRSPKSKDDL